MMTGHQTTDQDETVERSFMAQIKTVLTTVIAPAVIVLLSGGVLKIDEYINFILGGVTLISCLAALIIYKAYLAVKQDRENVRAERESTRLDNEELKKEVATLGYEQNVMAETMVKIADESTKDREKERDELIKILEESFKDTMQAMADDRKQMMAEIMSMKREIAAELDFKSTKKHRVDDKQKVETDDKRKRVIRTY